MSQWQPIETAPKDGTEVLLWLGQSQYPRSELGRWDVDSPYGPTWRCRAVHFSETLMSHWMPLPDPPAGGGEAA